MRVWLATAVAVGAIWAIGPAAAAQEADPVCLSLTERLRTNAFVVGSEYAAVDFHYRLYLEERWPNTRYVAGADALRTATFERLPVVCADSPTEALKFLVRVFARAGDFDGALEGARRQVEIAPKGDEGRRDAAMVLVARGDEAGALAEMRQVRAELSDAALLVDAYERGAAGGIIFDRLVQMALMEGAVRNGRLRLTQARLSWEHPEEDLARALTQLGERRRWRGEADQALAAYDEAVALLKLRIEHLRREQARGWQTAVVEVEDFLAETYAGLTESAAAKGDRARTRKVAEDGVALFASQRFAAPGSGIQGQILTYRFSGDPTARPAAKRLERMADALVAVGEVGPAAELYEAEAKIFAEDPARAVDLGRAYTRLASARRQLGEFAGAREAAEQGEQALVRGRAAQPGAGPGFLSVEFAAVRLEKAQVTAALGDRSGGCAQITEAPSLLPQRADLPEHKRVVEAFAAARPALCPTG